MIIFKINSKLNKIPCFLQLGKKNEELFEMVPFLYARHKGDQVKCLKSLCVLFGGPASVSVCHCLYLAFWISFKSPCAAESRQNCRHRHGSLVTVRVCVCVFIRADQPCLLSFSLGHIPKQSVDLSMRANQRAVSHKTRTRQSSDVNTDFYFCYSFIYYGNY